MHPILSLIFPPALLAIVLAQTVPAVPVVPVPPDPLGGWGTLVLQGGAFALLAWIVMRLAPAVLKDAREEREKRESIFTAVIGALQDRQDTRNKEIVDAIEKAIDRQTTLLNRGTTAGAQRIESAVKDHP